MEKKKFETLDGNTAYVEKIAEIFPAAVSEGKVNFDMLRTLLGDEIFDDEAYEFTWVGKREAVREAGRPIRKTLRPVVEDETTPTGVDSNGEAYCSSGSKDWDSTENLYIEGDNLDVLKLLQESYLGKIKMIYLDPPYNTGSDFVYRDSFAVSREEYEDDAGVYDEYGERLFKNIETNGRFHSDWCSMIYPRLVLARNLLAPAGVIFISIDDNEIAQLREICGEIFGESNFVAQFIWERAFSPKNDAKFVSNSHDYVVMYAKSLMNFSIGKLPRTEEANSRYKNPDNDRRGDWISGDLTVKTYNPNTDYEITTPSGNVVRPPLGVCWRVSKQRFDELMKDNRVWFGESGSNVPRLKRFLSEIQDGMTPTSLLFHKDVGHSQQGKQEFRALFEGEGLFDGPKPVQLLKHILIIANLSKDDIVLDFFSGSATAAHAVMQLNAEDGGRRKFIMVQLPEVCADGTEAAKAGYANICEIGKERIRRAGAQLKKTLEENGGDFRHFAKNISTAEKRTFIAPDGQQTFTVPIIPARWSKADETDENLEMSTQLDVGFRVLKLDESNMKDVYYSAGDYTQNMLEQLESNIKDDRTDMDLLFGCLLDWGLPLSLPHTHEQIAGVTVHSYNDGDLIACFADIVSDDVVKEIAKRQPLRAVFRDSSFSSSPEKINIEEIFKLLAPKTSIRVI